MSQPDRILASWGPGEIRVGALDGDQVIELSLVRPGTLAGAIVLGRIVGPAPTGNSLFVDIGADRPAFLANPPKSAQQRTQGQPVLVQVRADAVTGKGATVSMDIALPGRLVAYTPFRPGLAISRRLDDEERERLQSLGAAILEEGEGMSLRTHAAGASSEAIVTELSFWRQQWQDIKRAKAGARAPMVLWHPGPVDRLLAQYPDIREVRVDDAALYEPLRARLGDGVRLDRGGWSDMLDDALDEALRPVINLPDGGRVIFGSLSALTAIDVDSGSGSPAAANAQAVKQIARQLRLRGLGGQMVIDFIPSNGKGGLTNLASQLRRLVASDPVNTSVLGTTGMGLVELTRERKGPSIPELCLELRADATALAVGLRALRQAWTQSRHLTGHPITLRAAPAVITALQGQGAALADLQQRLSVPVVLETDKACARDDFTLQESPRP